MKSTLNVIALSYLALNLTACSSVNATVKKEFDGVRKGPAGKPYKSITNFSYALRCMDSLMLNKGIKNIPILVEAIEDKTETVKAGTRDMLITAISEMTEHSHGVKVIAYGKDAANLISYMKSAKNRGIYNITPKFDIHGSITQHDESVVGAGRSLGLFVSDDGGLGASRSAKLSVISLDLNILDTRDMSVIPGVSSHNSIAIVNTGKSFDTDASINKFGVYFDISLNRKEGKSQALRNLVELGAIETIGKLVKVPYQKCIGANNESLSSPIKAQKNKES